MAQKYRDLRTKIADMRQWCSSQRGQTVLEYSIFAIILVAAFFIGGVYVKRSIQGRWKSAVDDFGEQYDPTKTNGSINYILRTDANTVVNLIPDLGGYWTQRIDTANTTETRIGNVTN